MNLVKKVTWLLVVALSLSIAVGVAYAAAQAANLDQCRNGGVATPQTFTQCTGSAWVNGNAGASNSHYLEGESISYRTAVTGLNPGDTVVLILGYDVIHSNKYAIDYLTSNNRWQPPETDAGTTPDVPCSGVSPCNGPTLADIPAPPGSIHVDPSQTFASGQCIGTTTSGSGPLQPSTSFNALPAAERQMAFYNVTGTPTISYFGTTPDFTAPGGGDQEQQIQLTFTAAGSQVEISWGGHIASRLDWGCADGPLSAGGISGSPYHMRLKDMTVNGTHVNLGNQDRSLSANAVVVPFTLIINKTAVNGDATFNYTATGQGLPPTFSLTTSGGSASTTFSGLTPGAAGGSRTVTESSPPALWTFTSLSCSVTVAGDGTTAFSTNGSTVTITNGGAGATLTCTYTNTFNKASPTIATTLSATTANIGDSVHDSATLTGATSDAGGTVTYTVYTDNTCTTSFASAGTKTVTNGVVPDSDAVTFNQAGTFYWQAVYSGDANNAGASSDCTSEVLTVGKNSPTIATTLSATTANIGDSVSDSATMTGATADAGGTVTYTVYTDNACTTSFADAGTKTVTNGVVPDSDSVQFNSAGTFYWQAVYSGDANNNGATSDCTSEVLTVGKNSPTIVTTLSATTANIGDSVSDSATLSGATSDAGGTVTYTVYTDNACTTSFADAGTKTVTNGVVPDSDSVQFNSAGTFYWQAVYSGDANNNGATSDCTSEVLTVGKNSPTIATTLSATTANIGDSVSDSATLSGATSDAGGTVTYTVYTDNTCTTSFASAGTKTVTNGVVPDSDAVTFNQAGTFYWQAVYSGDANNNGATSDCTSEVLTVGKNSPTIATTLSATTANIGDSISDSATMTGATADAGGTVTYTVYTDNACSNSFADAGTKTVTNGIVPDSDGVQFNLAGTFYWQAVYSGDANNNGATSDCTSEVLTVGKNSPTIATTLSATTANIGDAVHDSATLTGATADAGGTVTYTVYTDNACKNSFADAGTKAVTNGVVPDSDAVTFNQAGTFYWQAVYSGDGNNNGATSDCTSEVLTVNKDSPTITTTPNPSSGTVGATLKDSATLSGGSSPTGTITFNLYAPSDTTCSGTPAFTETVTVNGNGSYSTSNGFVSNAAGTWRWTASYSGDGNNNSVSSGCDAEQVTITQPVQSQITPTGTTCTQFDSGAAATLSTLQYSVKSGKVNQVNPGVFFYWVKVTATAGSNTFTINQAITSSNNNFNHFFSQAAGSFAYTPDCVKINANISTSNGVTTVTFNASSAGTYIIGIKYDATSVTGFNAPSPNTTVDYTFTLAGSPSSTQGLSLVKK